VPDGSLTGGAVAKVKRFAGHLEDILKSVTESRHHLDEVAGEYAQAIRDNMAPIVGMVAGFIAAEAISMFAAATPTGVGQAAAMVIQLALSAFGAAGMVTAGLQALEHGSAWLNTAWTATGNEAKIVAASKEFLKMLVAIAMAALSALGARGNYRNLVKLGGSTPTGALPAFATAGARGTGDAGAATGVAIGHGTGAIGVGGAMMGKLEAQDGKKDTARSPKSEEVAPAPGGTSKPVEWTAHGNKHVAPSNVEWSRVVKSTRTGPRNTSREPTYRPSNDRCGRRPGLTSRMGGLGGCKSSPRRSARAKASRNRSRPSFLTSTAIGSE
jgi:hypothetical protein